MNVFGRAALVAGGVLVAGYGMQKLAELGDRNEEKRFDKIDQQTRAAVTEWNSWKTSAEAEFPGLRLETPDAHARFAQFMKRHPAPQWVTVDHADFTRVRISTDGFLSKDTEPDENSGGDVGIGFGIPITIAGGIGAALGIKGAATGKSLLGMTIGGGAAFALGAVSILEGVQDIKNHGKEFTESTKLINEVNSYR